MGTCCAPSPVVLATDTGSECIETVCALVWDPLPSTCEALGEPHLREGGYMLTHWPQRPQGFVMVLAVTCVAMAHLSNCQRIAP